jgi:hypothetical protein
MRCRETSEKVMLISDVRIDQVIEGENVYGRVVVILKFVITGV